VKEQKDWEKKQQENKGENTGRIGLPAPT